MSRSLGELEHQILLVVLRHGKESYSVDVVTELERRADREVAVSSAFVVLRRLEEKGYLESALAAPDPAEGGHARRYFRLTAEGLAAVRAAHNAYMALARGLEVALEG